MIAAYHYGSIVLFHRYAFSSRVSRANICTEQHFHRAEVLVTAIFVHELYQIRAVLSHVGQTGIEILDLFHLSVVLLMITLVDTYTHGTHRLTNSLRSWQMHGWIVDFFGYFHEWCYRRVTHAQFFNCKTRDTNRKDWKLKWTVDESKRDEEML